MMIKKILLDLNYCLKTRNKSVINKNFNYKITFYIISIHILQNVKKYEINIYYY